MKKYFIYYTFSGIQANSEKDAIKKFEKNPKAYKIEEVMAIEEETEKSY